MSKKQTIGILGCGHLGKAMARGLMREMVLPQELFLCDRTTDALAEFKAQGVQVGVDAELLTKNCDVIIVAVKPNEVRTAIEQLRPSYQGRSLIISVAAGISTSVIYASLGETARVARAMPNLPARIGMAATGVWARDASDSEQTRKICCAFGAAFSVRQENELDIVTGLSGSGPAYVARVIAALAAGATSLGLSSETAYALALETVRGTAELLSRDGTPPEEFAAHVATPGGTTERGLQEFNRSEIAEALQRVVEAATRRAAELRDKEQTNEKGQR